MRILLILLVSSFFSLTGFGQQNTNTVEYPDSGFTHKAEAKNIRIHGKKEGKWIIYSLRNETTFDSNSDYISYTLIVFKTGKRYGIERGYSRSGKLESLIPYLNDKANGAAKVYDTTTGKVFLETPYSNGKINGLQKVYYKPGGPIHFETTQYHNDKEGLTKYYDSTGAEIKQ